MKLHQLFQFALSHVIKASWVLLCLSFGFAANCAASVRCCVCLSRTTHVVNAFQGESLSNEVFDLEHASSLNNNVIVLKKIQEKWDSLGMTEK